MTSVRPLLLCLALLGCEARRPQAQDWVRSAPAPAATAISFRADWALQQPRLRVLLERYPLAGRSLDLFLTRVKLNLGQDPGRLTIYLTRPRLAAPSLGFLIQLGGFPDPGGLQVAIADVFPVEGSQSMENRDHPLFVLLDLDPYHIRAMADGEGRVWLGDGAVLARLATGPGQVSDDLAAASAWISRTAPIQGFIRPAELADQVPGELARNLPRGIDALAWGVTPGLDWNAPNGFELSVTGTEAAIEQASPWLQRFVAAAQAAPGAPAQPPEILQEARRLSLRCLLSQEQVDVAMARLDQPPLPCH